MLKQDNDATIITVMHEVTSWRPRHYALRAAGSRYMIARYGIVVANTRKGAKVVAGLLTKMLPKGEFPMAHEQLQMGHMSVCNLRHTQSLRGSKRSGSCLGVSGEGAHAVLADCVCGGGMLTCLYCRRVIS